MEKYRVYQWARFLILSFIVIYLFYFKLGISLTLVIILEIFVIIRSIPVTKFAERKIIQYYPKYKKFNKWIKRFILLVIYVIFFIILKFIILDLIIEGIFNVSVSEQINDLINQSQNS